METLNLLKKNLKFILSNSFEWLWGGWSGWDTTQKNQAEQLKNIEISNEAKIAKIKEYIEGNKLVSLDDNEDLKNELLQKLSLNKLDDQQINTIYSELQKIANIENQTFTSDVISEIKDKAEAEAVKDKFEKVQVKIRRIKLEALKDHLKEIVEAENMICKTLWDCSGVEKAKKDALSVSKEAQKELSTEKLQTITNNEFLKISPENRLQYITKNNIKSEQITNWTIKNLEFTFTFDWKFNEELYLNTTAWQTLPKEVWIIEKSWVEYVRNGLKWEFFNKQWERLKIKDIDKYWLQEKLTIKKLRSSEEIKQIQENNNKKLQVFEKSKDYKKEYSDIVSEAIKRWIDPKFAILAFSEKIKDLSLISTERSIMLEELFTEYDRKKWLMILWPDIRNTDKWFQARMLKSLYPEKWKEKIKEWWIKIPKEIVQNVDKTASYETKAEFVNLVRKESKIVEQKYWVPWEVTLWQAILESWYWKSALSKKYNNFFWHNAKPWEPYVIMNDHWHDRKFRVYSSVLEWLEAHWRFLSSTRYNKAMMLYWRKNWNPWNPRKFLEAINNAWYSETPDYADRIASVLKSNWVYI